MGGGDKYYTLALTSVTSHQEAKQSQTISQDSIKINISTCQGCINEPWGWALLTRVVYWSTVKTPKALFGVSGGPGPI